MNNFSTRNVANKKIPMRGVGVFLCLIGLCAIAFAITIRVIPNAIPPKLLILLHTTPSILNQLNLSYQNLAIICLVLSGLFVDIIGPRITLVVAITVAVIANHLFASGTSIEYMLRGRVLISLSYPFILTSVLTLGTHWLPRRHFSFFVGLVFGTFLLVPTFEFSFLKNVMTIEVLRKGILLANCVGVSVILSIIFTAKIADVTRRRHTLAGLFRPLGYYKVWLIAIVSMMGWISNTFLLHDGAFWLVHRFNYSMINAIELINTSFIIFSVGAIIMGMFSDYLLRKRYMVTLSYTLAAFLFSILAFTDNLPLLMVKPLLFGTAFLISSSIICYTKANDYCTIGNSGITLGLVLAISTVGSSFFTRFTTKVIRQNFESAMAWEWLVFIIPLVLVIGAAISFLLKPTHVNSDTGLLLEERV